MAVNTTRGTGHSLGPVLARCVCGDPFQNPQGSERGPLGPGIQPPGPSLRGERGPDQNMASFTLLYVRGHFVLTGPTIEPVKFETRRKAKDWAHKHFPGSLVKEVSRRPT
jgi:hypothetical protein